MDELGAELDGDRSLRIVMREHAASDPLPRFEHQDVDLFFVQRARGGNT